MAGLQVTVPALYLAGDRDFVVSFPGTDQLLANMKAFVPGLRKIQMLPGCGHWTSAGATERGQCRACGIHSSPAEPLMTMLTLPFPAAS